MNIGVNEFYLKILDDFPNPIWRSGIDAKCDYFNKAWLDFTGRTLEQEIGDGWAEGVHPDDIDRCLRTYLDAFHARKPFAIEYRLRHHNGEYHWILDYGKPFSDPHGNFAGYIGSCYDTTEKKRAEEEREKLIHELQDALAKVKTLGGLLPICSSCKRIRDDKGYWTQIEAYIRDHSEADFSHGICPECVKKLYPDM